MLVGIDKYENSSITGLEFAVADVKSVANRLKTGLGFDHVLTMTSDVKDHEDNDYPTALHILDRLDTLAAQIGPEDTFIFYFSGHGFQRGQDQKENFLGTIEANMNGISQLRRSTLPFNDLQEKMLGVKARQVIYNRGRLPQRPGKRPRRRSQ